MPRFRKKPVVVDAVQWFKNGDHPLDYSRPYFNHENGAITTISPAYRRERQWEGDVVRYYRHPDDDDQRCCEYCRHRMHDHGWIDTLEGGHIVCPGDWVITGVKGEHYPCKPDVFATTYDCVEETP